jgi:hypothetical protein
MSGLVGFKPVVFPEKAPQPAAGPHQRVEGGEHGHRVLIDRGGVRRLRREPGGLTPAFNTDPGSADGGKRRFGLFPAEPEVIGDVAARGDSQRVNGTLAQGPEALLIGQFQLEQAFRDNQLGQGVHALPPVAFSADSAPGGCEPLQRPAVRGRAIPAGAGHSPEAGDAHSSLGVQALAGLGDRLRVNIRPAPATSPDPPSPEGEVRPHFYRQQRKRMGHTLEGHARILRRSRVPRLCR